MLKKIALLIGVSDYGEGIPSLSAPPNDVEAMKRVLESPKMGGFDEVKSLINPNHTDMQLAINEIFAKSGKEDLVLLFFSGHGITDDNNRLYLATKGTSKNFFKATSVPASFIQDLSKESYAKRQVIILDCCYSGAFARGWQIKSIGLDLKKELGAEGRVVLTSSTATQTSFEQPGEKLSLYTQYFIEGIETGAADKDGDGKIYAEELHEYAKAKVKEVKPTMEPGIIIDKEGFKILLSQASINDPELGFRKLVNEYAKNGKISYYRREFLKVKQKEFGLADEKAEEIVNSVLEPFRRQLANLELYREEYRKEIEKKEPLDPTVGKDMKDWGLYVLGLKEQNIEKVQQQVLNEVRRARQLKADESLETAPSKPPHPLLLQVFEFEVTNIEVQRSGVFNLAAKVNFNYSLARARYFTEALGNGIGLDMVAIPGGEFIMGALKKEKDSTNNERPTHKVKIQPFFIGKYPITQTQWRAIASLPKIKSDLDPEPSCFKGDNRPVEGISWYDAIEFCSRLSQKTEREYRLPSEAEWEYAIRAGTSTPFYFGETITTELANYNGNHIYAFEPKGLYREETTPVGSFPPNAFGLYDMHGNIWEWCADSWHDNYEGAPTDGSAWIGGGIDRFSPLRGGSWVNSPDHCRCAYRDHVIWEREAIVNVIGFRVAFSGVGSLYSPLP